MMSTATRWLSFGATSGKPSNFAWKVCAKRETPSPEPTTVVECAEVAECKSSVRLESSLYCICKEKYKTH